MEKLKAKPNCGKTGERDRKKKLMKEETAHLNPNGFKAYPARDNIKHAPCHHVKGMRGRLSVQQHFLHYSLTKLFVTFPLSSAWWQLEITVNVPQPLSHHICTQARPHARSCSSTSHSKPSTFIHALIHSA